MSQNPGPNEPLPFSIEAERAVLGGIMRKNDVWDLISGVVLEEDFYKDEHKLIYKTIKNLQDLGKPVDPLTVQETLDGNGDMPKLVNLGGKGYVTQIAKETPGVANADQVIWYVVSDADVGTTSSLYGCTPIGIEIQYTLWGYNQPGAALGQIVFKNV